MNYYEGEPGEDMGEVLWDSSRQYEGVIEDNPLFNVRSAREREPTLSQLDREEVEWNLRHGPDGYTQDTAIWNPWVPPPPPTQLVSGGPTPLSPARFLPSDKPFHWDSDPYGSADYGDSYFGGMPNSAAQNALLSLRSPMGAAPAPLRLNRSPHSSDARHHAEMLTPIASSNDLPARTFVPPVRAVYHGIAPLAARKIAEAYADGNGKYNVRKYPAPAVRRGKLNTQLHAALRRNAVLEKQIRYMNLKPLDFSWKSEVPHRFRDGIGPQLHFGKGAYKRKLHHRTKSNKRRKVSFKLSTSSKRKRLSMKKFRGNGDYASREKAFNKTATKEEKAKVALNNWDKAHPD